MVFFDDVYRSERQHGRIHISRRTSCHFKKRKELHMKRIRFLDQLIFAMENDIGIDVEGVSYNDRKPQDVIAVMQNGSYMVDYDSDYQGQITAIHIRNVSRHI
ncbi:MAG: hypothetical protein J6N70_04545 [Oribacterium sp.]|nr:hypothetical protein [Oribacterium sp.]